MAILFTALLSLASLLAIVTAAKRTHSGWAELWTRGWAALSAGLVLAIVAPNLPMEPFTAAAAGACFALFGTALALGLVEFISHISMRMRTRSACLAAGAAAGAMISTAAGLSGLNGSLFVAAVVSVLTAIAGLWLLAVHEQRSLGTMIFGSSLCLMGSAGLGVSIAGHASPFGGALAAASGLAGFAIALLVVELQRDAAELAAREVEHLAYHDVLTGLPNRSLFFDRVVISLAHATRDHHGLAVLFLDIDRFKQINDSLGHTLGDTLLRAAGQRIRECLRPGDTLARFGGDEFTILLPRIRRIEEVNTVAARILEAVRRPLVIGNRELVVSTSIGAAVYPSDGLDAETLVRNADTAMYRAKEIGRDNCQLYTPELNSHTLERLDLENRLRKAVDGGEIVLFYQPIVCLETGALAGFEALVRWEHPDLGLLGPEHFIEAAEVSGLTLKMGEWTLRAACMQAAAWGCEFQTGLEMAVNLSARQLHEDQLVQHIRAALDASGLAPHLLTVEVTETHAMRNAEASIRILEEIRRMGVRVALDDFGTGYSSLAYLQRLPADVVKLDRSFVRDIDRESNSAIVIAVIQMARALGMRVVAEGVETDRQLRFLKRHRADQVQGFLISRPKPADECRALIRKQTGPIGTPRLQIREPLSEPEPRPERRLSGSFPRPHDRSVWITKDDWMSEN